MDLQAWLTFASASAILLLIPGPTVLLVLSYAISQGRRVALATVAGVAVGDFLAMSMSLVGLGTLVLASATLFMVLKWIGAAYLVFLGIKLFRSAPSTSLENPERNATATPAKVFAHSAAVTALNPKSIIFFIAFVPQFIAPEAELGPQFIVMIITFVGFAAASTLVYALLADLLRSRLIRPSVLPALTRFGGGTLVAMGVSTAMLRRSA